MTMARSFWTMFRGQPIQTPSPQGSSPKSSLQKTDTRKNPEKTPNTMLANRHVDTLQKHFNEKSQQKPNREQDASKSSLYRLDKKIILCFA